MEEIEQRIVYFLQLIKPCGNIHLFPSTLKVFSKSKCWVGWGWGQSKCCSSSRLHLSSCSHNTSMFDVIEYVVPISISILNWKKPKFQNTQRKTQQFASQQKLDFGHMMGIVVIGDLFWIVFGPSVEFLEDMLAPFWGQVRFIWGPSWAIWTLWFCGQIEAKLCHIGP